MVSNTSLPFGCRPIREHLTGQLLFCMLRSWSALSIIVNGTKIRDPLIFTFRRKRWRWWYYSSSEIPKKLQFNGFSFTKLPFWRQPGSEGDIWDTRSGRLSAGVTIADTARLYLIIRIATFTWMIFARNGDHIHRAIYNVKSLQ